MKRLSFREIMRRNRLADDAIRKGLGRTRHLLQQQKPSDQINTLVSACLERSLIYDQQSQPDRTEWLYELIRNHPDYPQISIQLIDALRNRPYNYAPDLYQLFGLVANIARQGDANAIQAIEDRCRTSFLDGIFRQICND